MRYNADVICQNCRNLFHKACMLQHIQKIITFRAQLTYSITKWYLLKFTAAP